MKDPRQFWFDLVAAPISHGAFRVAHALNQYTNQRGHAWPSIRTIAALIGACQHSVSRWLNELEAAGIVEVKRKKFRSSTVKLAKTSWNSMCAPVELNVCTSGTRMPTNFNKVKRADETRPALAGVPVSPPGIELTDEEQWQNVIAGKTIHHP